MSSKIYKEKSSIILIRFKMEDNKIIFIAYLDEEDNKIEGYFKLLLDNGIIIKFETKNNVITIPYNRVLKIKEKIDEVRDKGVEENE